MSKDKDLEYYTIKLSSEYKKYKILKNDFVLEFLNTLCYPNYIVGLLGINGITYRVPTISDQSLYESCKCFTAIYRSP